MHTVDTVGTPTRQPYRAGAGKSPVHFQPEDFPLKAFDGEHEPLYVRFLLAAAETRIALVSVEMTSLPPAAVERFRREAAEITGADHVFVCVTHTFSAPHIPPRIHSEAEERLSGILYARVTAALREAAEQALAQFGPAEIGYGTAPCGLNVNRNVPTPEGWWLGRNDGGNSCKDVRTVVFRRDGEPFALLVNYDVQSSVMDQTRTRDGRQLLSGDLVGMACAQLERFGARSEQSGTRLGEAKPLTAIFLPGCAGDQAPVLKARTVLPDGSVRDMHEDGYILAEQLGDWLAACTRNAVQAAGEFISEGAFDLRESAARLPEQEMRYPTKELRPHTSFAFLPTGTFLETPLAYFHLGPAGILTCQPELNSAFGTRVREILGEKLLLGTLINGAAKYLPEEEDFRRITYTAMNTGIGRGADSAFLDAVRKLRNMEEER